MAVVNSVKGETLQSKFDSRVSEVTGFNLTAKTVDTSAVDTFVASKVETDYTNVSTALVSTVFAVKLNPVTSLTLLSNLLCNVSAFTEFTTSINTK